MTPATAICGMRQPLPLLSVPKRRPVRNTRTRTPALPLPTCAAPTRHPTYLFCTLFPTTWRLQFCLPTPFTRTLTLPHCVLPLLVVTVWWLCSRGAAGRQSVNARGSYWRHPGQLDVTLWRATSPDIVSASSSVSDVLNNYNVIVMWMCLDWFQCVSAPTASAFTLRVDINVNVSVSIQRRGDNKGCAAHTTRITGVPQW